jgi:hypothetical protein
MKRRLLRERRFAPRDSFPVFNRFGIDPVEYEEKYDLTLSSIRLSEVTLLRLSR